MTQIIRKVTFFLDGSIRPLALFFYIHRRLSSVRMPIISYFVRSNKWHGVVLFSISFQDVHFVVNAKTKIFYGFNHFAVWIFRDNSFWTSNLGSEGRVVISSDPAESIRRNPFDGTPHLSIVRKSVGWDRLRGNRQTKRWIQETSKCWFFFSFLIGSLC